MNKQTRPSALDSQQDMRVRTFPTVEAFFEGLFGPAQHDAHVQTRHKELFLRKWEARHAMAREATQ